MVAAFNPEMPNAEVGKLSIDSKYLGHEFVTYQGGYQWTNGWTPSEAREAVNQHLRGMFWQSAALARDVVRYPPIMGALKQRLAPALRTRWNIEPEDARAPLRFAVEDLRDVWTQFRRIFGEILLDYCLMGFCWIHHHLVVNEKGIEVPKLKKWPLEAVQWFPRSPAREGGYYAITIDSGTVRMVHGDGHWTMIGNGERPHMMGAIMALALSYVGGELARRDRAGLSESAGRASPTAELPEGISVESEIGKTVQQVVAGLGRARKGAVVPFGTKLGAFNIVSDTSFFTDSLRDELSHVAFAVLGQSGTLAQGVGGVYSAPVFEGVAEALVDEQHEATERGFTEGLCKPLTLINYPDVDADQIKLCGARPNRDEIARLKAKADQNTSLGTTVKAWRDAGLEPEQTHVDALAAELGVETVPLGSFKEPTGPGGALVTVASEPVAGKGAVDDPAAAVKAETAEVNDVDPVGQGQSQSNS